MSLERQVRAKILAKRDPVKEQEAKEWVEAVLGAKFPANEAFEDVLKDGTILCQLINKLKPGSIAKINTSGGQFKMMENVTKKPSATSLKMEPHLSALMKPAGIPNTSVSQFKIMENITNFQKAIKEYGVPDIDVFQTVDLVEKKDIGQVVNTIHALGRETYRHPEWKGPYLGPKPSDECKRDFSEEVLKGGQNVIGLQAGSNKGATQAGQNMGAGRKILLGK